MLLPEVTTKSDELRDIWDGLSRVKISGDSVVVVLTPHSDGMGVYADPSGSLAGFGLPHLSVQARSHPLPTGLPVLGGPLDHGAVVPLMLMGISNEAAAVGLGDGSDITTIPAALDVVRALANETDVFVLASAHTSARLTERAPLKFSFEAVRVDARLVTEIETDCAAARDLADEMRTVGDSCSRSTLHAFGALFAGAEGTVLAYGSPFGVGYPVVVAETDV